MQKKIAILVCFIFVFLFEVTLFGKKLALTNKSNAKWAMSVKAPSKTEEYKAKVEGIECPCCAESVAELVKKVDGVTKVTLCVAADNNVENGELVITWNTEKGNILQELIEEALNEEEFTLVSLERVAKS